MSRVNLIFPRSLFLFHRSPCPEEHN